MLLYWYYVYYATETKIGIKKGPDKDEINTSVTFILYLMVQNCFLSTPQWTSGALGPSPESLTRAMVIGKFLHILCTFWLD